MFYLKSVVDLEKLDIPVHSFMSYGILYPDGQIDYNKNVSFSLPRCRMSVISVVMLLELNMELSCRKMCFAYS